MENDDFFGSEKTCELVLFLLYGYLLMTRRTNKTSSQVFSDPKKITIFHEIHPKKSKSLISFLKF
jgi:hypothetical protein